MKKFAHVIWDWNGTLLDDIRLLREIVNGFLERYGLPVLTDRERGEIFGFPVKEYYKKMGFDLEKVSYKQICIDFGREYYNRATDCKLRSGAREILQSLKQAGVAQSILSASEQKPLETLIEIFGIRDFFTDVVGRNDHSGGSKIDRARQYMESAKLSPEHVVIIGDTDHDFEAANATGTDCILVNSGYQIRRRLEDCGCPVVDALEQIMPHLV